MYGTYSPPPVSIPMPQSDHAKLFRRNRSANPSNSDPFRRDTGFPCSVPRSTPMAIPNETRRMSFLAQQAMLKEYNQQYKASQKDRRTRSSSNGSSYSGRHVCDHFCDELCELSSLDSPNSTGDNEPDAWLDTERHDAHTVQPALSHSVDFEWSS